MKSEHPCISLNEVPLNDDFQAMYPGEMDGNLKRKKLQDDFLFTSYLP